MNTDRQLLPHNQHEEQKREQENVDNYDSPYEQHPHARDRSANMDMDDIELSADDDHENDSVSEGETDINVET